MTEQTPNPLRDQYAAAIYKALRDYGEGDHDPGTGSDYGDQAAVVMAVRDTEMERMKLLVAASSEDGHAVRMAADATIRAKQAEAETERIRKAALQGRGELIEAARVYHDRALTYRAAWHSAKQRASKERARAEFYEAALARMRDRKEVAAVRVRKAVDELCSEPHPNHDHVCPDDVRHAVLAALDEHQEQPDTRQRCRCGHARDLHNGQDCAGCTKSGVQTLSNHAFIEPQEPTS